jgi:hypothetical protein
MMEHRQGRRIAARTQVWLQFRDRAVTAATASNIGRGGMFVRTSQRPDANCCLEVLVELPDDRGETAVPVPAMVVHRSRHGVGLMFRELDPQAAKVVECLLRDVEAGTLSSPPTPRRPTISFDGAEARS